MSRDRVVSFRLTEDEYREMEGRARWMGCSVSDLARRSILSRRQPKMLPDGHGAISVTAPLASIVWWDGTANPSWPAPATS